MKKLAYLIAAFVFMAFLDKCLWSAASPAGVLANNCTQKAISNSTPTEITGNTAYPSAGVWAVKVSNLDTAANLCCSQDSSVSCSAGSHHGEVVAPTASGVSYAYLSWIIGVNQGWYCINSGSGSTNAEVCLAK